MKTKNYYIVCDMGENIPYYDFVVKAKTRDEAMDIAIKELRASYPDQYDNVFPTVRELTADELLSVMTIN